jgi:thioredoxin-related protein
MDVRKVGISLAVFLFAAFVVLGQGKTPQPAKEVVSKAVKVAKAQNKTVLLEFGASWCSWCKRFDAMIESPQVGKLFKDNYVIAHLTIQESDDKKALENSGAQEMADEAGAGKAGVPVYLFLDSTGKRIATSLAMPKGENIGHPATPEEIKAFDGLLTRTAPRMTASQRAQISDYLTKDSQRAEK